MPRNIDSSYLEMPIMKPSLVCIKLFCFFSFAVNIVIDTLTLEGRLEYHLRWIHSLLFILIIKIDYYLTCIH